MPSVGIGVCVDGSIQSLFHSVDVKVIVNYCYAVTSSLNADSAVFSHIYIQIVVVM